MRYVGLEHIEPQTMKLLGYGYARETRSSSVRFSKDDVLYGKMRPYLNKVWVAEFDGLCSAEFLVFPKRDAVNNQFFAVRLNAEDFVTFANGQVSGERPRVDFEKLSPFSILLPPIAEQERIVTKLVAALSRLARAETAARRAHERLKRYRVSVLEAAVTGELTRSWREARRNNNTESESGDVVSERLLAARRFRWERAELKRLRERGKVPKNDAWKAQYPEATKPDTADLPELPDTWSWASLEMVAELGSGISVSQNRRVKNPIELPYLRVANVLRGRFDLGEIKRLRVEKDRVADYLLRVGDILFNEGGDRDKLGRGWVWDGQIRRCIHQNHVFRARLFDPSLLNPKLVSHWGNTFGQRFFLRHGKQTTNLASINRGVLGKLPVPIAPIEEQAEILIEVQGRLVAADRLATRVEQQLARTPTTRQSLLREAFTGRLVPQDANDEPASVLLGRIGAAREAEKLKGKPMPNIKYAMNTPMRRSVFIVLKENNGPMTPEALFRASGYAQDSVDDFFAELRQLTANPPKVAEERSASGLTLLKVVS